MRPGIVVIVLHPALQESLYEAEPRWARYLYILNHTCVTDEARFRFRIYVSVDEVQIYTPHLKHARVTESLSLSVKSSDGISNTLGTGGMELHQDPHCTIRSDIKLEH